MATLKKKLTDFSKRSRAVLGSAAGAVRAETLDPVREIAADEWDRHTEKNENRRIERHRARGAHYGARIKQAGQELPYMLEDLLADGGKAEVVHTAVKLDGKTALVRKSAGIASHNRRMSCKSNVVVEMTADGLEVTVPADFKPVTNDYVPVPLDGGRPDLRPGIRAETVTPVDYVTAARTYMWAGNVRVQIAGKGMSL